MSLGSELSAARRASGLTVDDVAAASRLRPSIVTAIEQDDFAPCGGDVYARGHVRTIAAIVGLDPDAMASRFDEVATGT